MPLRPPAQADRISEETIKMMTLRYTLNSPISDWNKHRKNIKGQAIFSGSKA
jgi:hypothetical protein